MFGSILFHKKVAGGQAYSNEGKPWPLALIDSSDLYYYHSFVD